VYSVFPALSLLDLGRLWWSESWPCKPQYRWRSHRFVAFPISRDSSHADTALAELSRGAAHHSNSNIAVTWEFGPLWHLMSAHDGA
jgi:hypothetical protein